MDKLEALIARIEEDGQITKDEINELNDVLLEDGKLDDEERFLLNRLLAKLQRGELKEV